MHSFEKPSREDTIDRQANIFKIQQINAPKVPNSFKVALKVNRVDLVRNYSLTHLKVREFSI